MHVAADAPGGADALHFLDGRYGVGIGLPVYRTELAFVEAQRQGFRTCLLHLFEIGALRQALLRIEDLPAADRCTPEPYVIGILQFREVGRKAVGVEVIHFLLPRQVPVAGERDDLYAGTHHQEHHVEADLVVPRAGGAVGDGVGPDLLRIAGHGHRLEQAFR